MDDMVEEILLRFPPEDPGRLFRASLVSKPWRSLLTSSVFSRRYRQFHRTPPLLGFFVNNYVDGSRFSPLSPTSPFLPIRSGGRKLVVVDSRHGLVLLKVNFLGEGENPPFMTLVVWDPVGRRQWELPPPDMAHTTHTYDDAAVVCAADGCDHLGCCGGPFLVAYVRTDLYGIAYASVFSSQTRAWSLVTSCQGPGVYFRIIRGKPKAFVGNVLYFKCAPPSATILRCDLVSQELSMIDGPNMKWDDYVLMTTEDGRLGCANVHYSRLCLWSMEARPDGAVAWMNHNAVGLEKLLPSCATSVISFAAGVGVFFLKTEDGIFTIELKSGRVKMVSASRFGVTPYMSFYTPDQARAMTLPSTMASSLENVEAARDWYHDQLLLQSSRQMGDLEGEWEEKCDNKMEGDDYEEEKTA